MPSYGDIKWRATGLLTASDIQTQINCVLTEQAWVTMMTDGATNLHEVPDVVTLAFNILASAVGMASGYFFNTYLEELKDLKTEIVSLAATSPNTPFQIQQKFKHHSGHKAWQPMTVFRVATGADLV